MREAAKFGTRFFLVLFGGKQMFTMIFAEITQGFKRIWKLYLTNILSIMLVILLYSYLDGSRRQLNLQNTVFSGEVVVKMATNVQNVPETIAKKITELSYVSEKLRTFVQYRLPGSNSSFGNFAELIGVDFTKDKNLQKYLTLKAGKLPKDGRDVLIPSSLLQKVDIKVGSPIRVSGQNSAKYMNSASYKVCGIYNSPGLSLFESPRLLVKYSSMEAFFMPSAKDIEYSLFFKGGKIPETINKDLRDAFNDTNRILIDSIERKQVSSFDVLNISVQFNVFLILMILLTIAVVVTVVFIVNFNIHLILFRKRQKEIGTLMSFGVRPWKIGLTLFLESVFQLILSTAAAVIFCFLISLLAKQQIAGGFVEVLFVLLSGTNRIDFYIQFYQIGWAFLIIFCAITISQIPVFIRVLTSNPIEVMSNK
jgi:ABC-type lipoprotein release transport system permease subunit